MHVTSYRKIEELFKKYLDINQTISMCDVGSYDVNGTYKRLITTDNWKYTGLDITDGPNVDIIAANLYDWSNVQSNTFDVVISGQTLEHVAAPWLWIKEIIRICKPGGLIIIIAPWKSKQHRYPIDCWRILPDGMSYLLKDWGGLEILEVDFNNPQSDCWGVARKPCV